jgi:hypothetical protein
MLFSDLLALFCAKTDPHSRKLEATKANTHSRYMIFSKNVQIRAMNTQSNRGAVLIY